MKRVVMGIGVVIVNSALAGCENAPLPVEQLGATRSSLDVNPDVVISQVYGGGGNNGAVYTHDFVELFNRSASAVTLMNTSLQYAAATGGNFSNFFLLPNGTVLQPGQHLLIRLASQAAVGQPLPGFDLSGSINMSGTSGKVALVRSTTALACNGVNCSQADLDKMIDVVGYGNLSSSPFFEGAAAAPTLSNTTAAIRGTNGCNDTNQNSIDFSAGAPNPRTLASAATPCVGGNVAPSVTSVSPANGSANVGYSGNISVTFSEPVVAPGSWFGISCTLSGLLSATVSGGPQIYALDPSVDLQPGETCTVTLSASAVVDNEGLAMTSDYVFSFTTLTSSSGTPIHAIQGASHVSPLKGSTVTTRGIVTARDTNGYYLQDPAADADPATSEAVFVFTSTAPPVQVGDDVVVSGTVAEFRSGCTPCGASDSAFDNLTATELASVTAQTVLSGGHALPAPIVLGVGGRVPPSSVIEDDASGDVEVVVGTFDPENDGLDFFESLEGMRVQLNDAVAVGPTTTFSSGSKELPVLADNGGGATGRTARGGVVITASDFNPERITLANDLVSSMPAANLGDTLPGSIVGVMSYTFGNPKLFYSQALPALVASGVTREVTTLGARRPLELDFATFNVENLDPGDPGAKFDSLADILVNSLKSPDVVAIEEAQDNDGAANTGTVAADQTFGRLIAAITTAGGPSYSYQQINPVNNQDGGEPSGNIRVGFLYRTDRGLSFFSHPGDSTTPNAVIGSGAGTSLQLNPGRLDPSNSVFNNSRKPLAAQFSFAGQSLFVIVNHFNSKGGDDPLFGRFQPPVLSSETQRSGQANVVKTFVSQLLAASASAQVLVLGDLNDFEFSAPLLTLKSGGLSDFIETLPQNERYSYVYQGNSQVLDHILGSALLSSHLVAFDVVHVNSEFATQASDHDPSIARISFDRVAPSLTLPSTPPVVTATSASGASVTFSVTATDDQDGDVAVTCSPASGSSFPIGTTQVTCSATDAGRNAVQASFAVKVVGGSMPAPAAPWVLVSLLGLALGALGTRRARA